MTGVCSFSKNAVLGYNTDSDREEGQMLNFKKVQIEDQTLFNQYTICHGYHNVEACFGNIFLWSRAWDIRMAVDDIALYLVHVNCGEHVFMLPPFLKDCEADIGEAIRRSEAYIREKFDKPTRFKGVTPQFKEKIENDCPGEFTFTEDRPNYEYVYLSENLASLKGKKLSAKRNHINKLVSKHEFEYRRNYGDMNAACVAFQKEWIEKRGGMNEDYRDELYVTETALENMDALGIRCGMLFVDGQLEAFTLGQQHGEDMAVIHIEKANPDLQGAYPLINREFVRNEWAHVKYINREEDMGLEGLRRAKLSYNPVFLLEKYDCVRV